MAQALVFSLQDEPLSLDYSRISLTHSPLSLKMLLFLLHPALGTPSEYWAKELMKARIMLSTEH